MSASRFVGRAGTLAAALGVGVALSVLVPGLAWAEPTDPSAPASAPAEATDAAGGAPARSDARTRAERSRPAAAPPSDTPAGLVDAAPASRQPASNRPPSPEAGPERNRSQPSRQAARTAAPVAASVPLPAAPAVVRVDAPVPAAAPSPLPLTAVLTKAAAISPALSSAAPAATAAPAAPVPAAIDSLLAPLLGTIPSVPAESALSWAVLAVARREIESGLPVPAAATVPAAAAAPTNQPPVIASVTLGTPSTSTGALRASIVASDPENGQLSYSVSVASKGTATISTTGVLTYTPTPIARHAAAKLGAATSVTTDTVTVTVSDAAGAKATTVVTLPVSPRNTAPTATATISAPNPVTGVATGTVRATDADQDPLTYTASRPANGSVAVRSDGSFAYTPTAAARTSARSSTRAVTDTFTITVSDGYGGSRAVTVTATIAPSNSAPRTTAPTISVNANSGVVTGSVNATDPDRDALRFTVATATTTKGSVSVTQSGGFTYTPTAAARHAAAKLGAATSVKTDQFNVTVTDSYGAATVVTVNVPVTPANVAPVAGPTTVGKPDSTTGVVLGAVTATDADADALTYATPGSTARGTVTINARTGSFTYTPTDAARATATADTTDTFTVTVTDGFGGSAAVAVAVPVAPKQVVPQNKLTFNFVYGSGAENWTPAARSALEAAANQLAAYFVVSAPVTLVFDVSGENSPESDTLASSGSDLISTANGFYRTVAQNKILSGVDSNGTAADGVITWNFGSDWALGDTVGDTQYDFTSTAIHEMLHALGFLSYVDEPTWNGGQNWTVFDSFIVTSGGTKVIGEADYRWNSANNSRLTGRSGGLFFGGKNAVDAYGGLVPLYTPSEWQPGSSVTHLDDDTFTGSNAMLMNAATDTGPGIRVLSNVELGILRDLGYTVIATPVRTPGGSALLFIGLVFLRRRRKS